MPYTRPYTQTRNKQQPIKQQKKSRQKNKPTNPFRYYNHPPLTYTIHLTKKEFKTKYGGTYKDYRILNVNQLKGREYIIVNNMVQVKPPKMKHLRHYIDLYNSESEAPPIRSGAPQPGGPDRQYRIFNGHRRWLAHVLTGGQWIESEVVYYNSRGQILDHPRIIIEALEYGYHVPERVLEDYPRLKP